MQWEEDLLEVRTIQLAHIHVGMVKSIEDEHTIANVHGLVADHRLKCNAKAEAAAPPTKISTSTYGALTWGFHASEQKAE